MENTKKETSIGMKIFKKILIGILSLLVVLLIVVGVYVSVITAKYYRVGDIELTSTYSNENIDSTSLLMLDMNKEYQVATYNIGFGAYSEDFTFFMDGGKSAKAKDKDSVLFNTLGVAKVLNSLDVDFAFLQEVDLSGTRSRYVDQVKLINSKLNANYEVTYGSNFHVPYLVYPFHDPIGKAESGIVTLSKYASDSAMRYELPVDTAWPSKLFDLDRCYTVNRSSLPNGKELLLINVHLTAFENKGIREKQLANLEIFLKSENDKGNYIVMGGDFNHDLWVTFVGDYNSDEKYYPSWLPKKENITKEEEWVQVLNQDFVDFLDSINFSFKIPLNEPTCRTSQFSYNPNTSRAWVIDGFIVSGNIKVIEDSVMVVDDSSLSGFRNFLYSDHNPVTMKFTFI
ncbi:endonuclease/exonuclease/phosphatase family protein [Acholeplasma sp. OttesenSCG-928-E16]|nr:endonuclease/exonuclease/phosphatase family protein [Acholeplasma sp. OttesenSCG-928-E16]